MITKKGINASPGVAIGPALVLDTEEFRIPRRTVEAGQVRAELQALDAALEASRQEVNDLRTAAARTLGEKTSAIFSFHESFIGDPKLRDGVAALIEEHHFTAAYAFGQVMGAKQKPFRAVTNPYLKERVRDLIDIERRVLRHILGKARENVTRLTEPVVIIAHDITPSQAISFDRRHILGFAINVGGQTSHMAIIARQLGIPAVVALTDVTSDITGGELVIVDGANGIVIAAPDDAAVERYAHLQRENRETERELLALRDLPSATLDGAHVSLLANIELTGDVSAAMDSGAEGIGLNRREMLFLASQRLPSEEEQYEAFRAAVTAARGRPVVIRTIDLGADKLAPAISAVDEQNPALGLRSLRYCLLHLDMFRLHLRAILRASAEGDVRIMFPMISTLMELRQAKATLADVMEDLEEEGVPYRADVPVGMMVETPSAAMLADVFAREVGFFSIGTNDLTQYTLAVDRANERVAHLYSPHNPAVLRLIRHVVRTANRHGVSVTLCGEMAGQPIYGPLLIGLGLRQLSMAPKDVLAQKSVVRSMTIRQCENIAQHVLAFDSDRQVLNYLRGQGEGEAETNGQRPFFDDLLDEDAA